MRVQPLPLLVITMFPLLLVPTPGACQNAFSSLPVSQIPLPTRVEFAEADLRVLFPTDGQLMEQGTRGKDYVGVALGRRVLVNSNKVVATNDKVGAQGVAFRDGYIEINIGAHAEREQKLLLLKTMFALNTTVTARIQFDDDLHAKVSLDWHSMDGDNLGGKLVVPFAQGEIKKMAQRQANEYATSISETVRKTLPTGIRLHVDIKPGYLTVVRLSPSTPPNSPVTTVKN